MTDRKVKTLTPVSSQAAKNFRMQKIMNNPVTLASLVSGAGLFLMLTGWYGLAFKSIGAILSESLVFIGLGNLGLDIFLRKDKHQMQYLERHKVLREQSIKERSDYLIDELHDLDMDNLGELVRKINQFFENFKDVLEDKFEEENITYAEFLSIGEQFTIAVLNKLLDISTKYKSVALIDIYELEDQLTNTRDEKVHSSLKARIALKQEQNLCIENTTQEIEETLTQLLEFTVIVSNITDSSRDEALQNLQNQAKKLATQTNLYLPEKGL